MPRFHRYVALGDSTTEGLEDPHPAGGYRGWADRLAERLAVVDPDVRYANLAIRGRKLGQIRAEQLGPALAMEPDLASVVGGVNDMLRPRVDLDAIAADLEAMVAALTAGGATVVLVTYPDLTALIPVAGRVAPRFRAFSAEVRRIAAAHERTCLVDLEREGVVDARLWHVDRLHANADGHDRIAEAAAAALGLPGAGDAWRAPLPPVAPPPRHRALVADLRWAGAFLAPWISRRLRGRSSGDGVLPKRPVLAPVLGG